MDLTRAEWRKASYSTGNGGACVEVAQNLPGIVAVRDSKDPGSPAPGLAGYGAPGPFRRPPGPGAGRCAV